MHSTPEGRAGCAEKMPRLGLYCAEQYNAHMSKQDKTTVLQTRLTPDQKKLIQKAAKLHHLSLSDYVRQILLSMARQEVESAKDNVIRLTPEGQLEFWNAINEPVELTESQKRLGRIIRGEE